MQQCYGLSLFRLVRIRTAAFAAVILATAVGAFSQTTASATVQPSFSDRFVQLSSIRLWDGNAPGAVGNQPSDIPILTVFRAHARNANGTAVIIAPGGGYSNLSANLEGRLFADWFAARGVTAFVLRYRLGAKYFYPVPLEDAQRAIRLVRARAKDFGISPDRIGMIGFSAGGHLTAAAATIFDSGKPDAADPVDRVSSRPDFIILGYPWLDAMERTKRSPSQYCEVLKVDQEKCKGFNERYSPALHVTPQTPPAFIFHTVEDTRVPVETSVAFFTAMHKARVPVEMHLFEKGGHGSGLAQGEEAGLWPSALDNWMRTRGLLTPDPAWLAAQKEAARNSSGPLTVDSRLGELLNNSAAKAVLVKRWSSQDWDDPQISQIRGMSIRQLAQYSEFELSKAMVDAIQSDLEKIAR